MCSSSLVPSRTHSIPHLTFFNKKSTRPSLEDAPHSEVKKIFWPSVWYTALYISSWNCASRGTLVAPVVSPCPANRRDMREKFLSAARIRWRIVGYIFEGNSVRSPWSRDSAYLKKKWAMEPGAFLWRGLTCDVYALGNSKLCYPSHRVPLVAIQLYNNCLIQSYYSSPLIMNLMLAPVEVCAKVLDFPVMPSFGANCVQKFLRRPWACQRRSRRYWVKALFPSAELSPFGCGICVASKLC